MSDPNQVLPTASPSQVPATATEAATEAAQEPTPANVPDACPSCGAGLVDVPDVKDRCPHCMHVFTNLLHFGAQHWGRNARQLRDGEPEAQAAVDAEGVDYVGPKGRS